MSVVSPSDFWEWLNSLGPVPYGLLWLAALGSSFGIPALLFTVVQLWRKNKESETQIAMLSNLANDSLAQTSALKEMVEAVVLQEQPRLKDVGGNMPTDKPEFDQDFRNYGAHAKSIHLISHSNNFTTSWVKHLDLPHLFSFTLRGSFFEKTAPEEAGRSFWVVFRIESVAGRTYYQAFERRNYNWVRSSVLTQPPKEYDDSNIS